MRKKIYLDADRLKNRKDMHDYLEKAFDFPFWFGYNLDALYDCLSEVKEDTDIILDQANATKICQDPYAYRVLLTLSDGIEENPHLRILFYDPEDEEDEEE
jgi:ribonuclease inhibitor